MLGIVTGLLAIGLIVAVARYRLLRRELGRMARAMDDIHSQHTGRQLTINTQVPQVAELATQINTLYDDVDAEQAASRAAMDEMRQSMANISHDLRTPLTSILGYLKLLQGGGNAPEQAASYLAIAQRKAQSLNQLVGGLFELARLESGGYVLQQQRLDAGAVLADELAAAYTRMMESGIEPEVSLDDKPLWIIGDKNALGRVFANLIQNMIKHGLAPMQISAQATGGTVVVRFANRVEGLDPEVVDQLFGRFFTNDRMRSGKDTGLGLAIVKALVEQMNGQVEAVLEGDMLAFVLTWTAL